VIRSAPKRVPILSMLLLLGVGPLLRVFPAASEAKHH
jgi:hypothetical protein